MTKKTTKLTSGILPPCESEVLVVEDDPQLRETALEILALGGFMAAGAANGAEALTFLQKEAPKVILLDLRMPVLDGWAFLARRARDPVVSAVPVIVLSGEPSDPRVLAAVDGWIAKPFDESTLLNTVTAVLAAKAATHDAPVTRTARAAGRRAGKA
jgi:two-component system response regulator CpxR